jgi:hypothetical protein
MTRQVDNLSVIRRAGLETTVLVADLERLNDLRERDGRSIQELTMEVERLRRQLRGAVAAIDEAITTLGLLRGYVEMDSEAWAAVNACQRSLMQALGREWSTSTHGDAYKEAAGFEVVPAEQLRGTVEENRVLSRALSIACKAANPADISAMKDWCLRKAGEQLDALGGQ